jgi:hypothetical protein
MRHQRRSRQRMRRLTERRFAWVRSSSKINQHRTRKRRWNGFESPTMKNVMTDHPNASVPCDAQMTREDHGNQRLRIPGITTANKIASSGRRTHRTTSHFDSRSNVNRRNRLRILLVHLRHSRSADLRRRTTTARTRPRQVQPVVSEGLHRLVTQCPAHESRVGRFGKPPLALPTRRLTAMDNSRQSK